MRNTKDSLLTDLSDIDYYLNESQPSLPYVINWDFQIRRMTCFASKWIFKWLFHSTGSASAQLELYSSVMSLQAMHGKDSNRLHESIRISTSNQTPCKRFNYL